MKRSLLSALILGLVVAGCSDSNPSGPSGPGGSTENVVFNVQMLPSNEVPPVSNAEASGSGTVTITFVLSKDSAGQTIGATANFAGSFSGFPAGMALTAAHIHPGGAGTIGGVAVNTAIASGEVSFPAGSGTLSKNGIAMTTALADSIVANPSGYYFNIHTAANPGGVARGQLVKQ